MSNEKILKENDFLKDIVKGTRLLTQGESSQTKENEKSDIYAQAKFDTLSAIFKKKYAKLMVWMRKFQGTHSKCYATIKEHKRINDKIQEKNQEVQKKNTSDSGSITTTNELMRKHQGYYKELQADTKQFVDVAKEGVPTLFGIARMLKEKIEWIEECRLVLHRALEVATRKDS